VLTPYDPGVGVSRKITDKDERKRIKDIVGDVSNKQKVGCIVRTAAENRSEKDLKGEYKYLMNLWEKIKNRVDKNKAPSLVYEEYGIVLRIVRDVFTDDYTSLIIDSREEYQRIMRFLSSFRPELRKKIKLYSARTPLFQKHDLEKKINQIFERKVSLPSGGYLIIEQTEGVVVIDVNTGSYVGRKSLEQTAFKTNIEAAEEIPRQLMLRDVGGIVIMDFIDMDRKEHSDKVYRVLQDSLKNDKARVSIRGMSQFGIVEMTRQRMRKSLEWSSHIECPYCGGKGMIKSPETIAIEAARKIGRVLSGEKKKRKKLTVYVHPDINHEMLSDQARVLSDIQRKYRCNIDLIQDNSLHIEDIVIEEA
jgi:ribonuclease G